jgi:hypothetical protein
MADPRKGKPYYRPYSPGMGCASGNGYPGEHPAGTYTPPPEREGGAAEALIPHSPYDGEPASGSRLANRLGFKSISGRY